MPGADEGNAFILHTMGGPASLAKGLVAKVRLGMHPANFLKRIRQN